MPTFFRPRLRSLQHRVLGLGAHYDDRGGVGAQGRLELLLKLIGGLDVDGAASPAPRQGGASSPT
jgi:hypothetical protein